LIDNWRINSQPVLPLNADPALNVDRVENLCPWIQIPGHLPENFNIWIPNMIWLPNDDAVTVLVLNTSAVEHIRAEDNDEGFAILIRAKVAAIPNLYYNASGYDQRRLSEGSGSVALGGLTAPGRTYALKTPAQLAAEEAAGGPEGENSELAVTQKTRLINVAFLSTLFVYDFIRLHELLGPTLDFKAVQLPGRIAERTIQKKGLIALGKESIPFLLSGTWTSSLMPVDGESAINGKFVALSIQSFMYAKTPHPSDPKGAQKKFIVGRITSGQELRNTVENIPDLLNAVVTGFTHPPNHNMLTASFEPLLRDIWVEGDTQHPSKNADLNRLFSLVSKKIGVWFSYAQKYYPTIDSRPSGQDFLNHSRELLSLTRDEIERDKVRGGPIDEQFSNEWFPSVVQPVGKEKQPGGKEKAAGPYQQPKGTVPNPPGTKKLRNASGKPVVVPQAVVQASVIQPARGSVPVSQQLCLNLFAGYVGAGPTCNKPPGTPCTRNHNFSPPTPPAKWPVSILDAAEDAANRVGKSNLTLKANVLAAIALLR
jgi:hypothetical protein